MDKLQLFFNSTVKIEGIGEIFQPTIDDIKNPMIGEKKYNELIIPFITSTDMFNISDQYKSIVKVFDLFFIKDEKGEKLLKHNEGKVNEKPMLDLLVESLKFFFKTEEIKVDEHYMSIMVGCEGLIYRENFDMLSDLVLEINNIERPVLEKVPEFTSDKQKDVYTKLTEGRRKKREQETKSLMSIINIVMHGGKTFISYDEIKKFTISQLYNTYSSVVQIDYCNREYDKYLAGANPKDLDLKHWTERLKI
jgi:hypothetical protein